MLKIITMFIVLNSLIMFPHFQHAMQQPQDQRMSMQSGQSPIQNTQMRNDNCDDKIVKCTEWLLHLQKPRRIIMITGGLCFIGYATGNYLYNMYNNEPSDTANNLRNFSAFSLGLIAIREGLLAPEQQWHQRALLRRTLRTYDE